MDMDFLILESLAGAFFIVLIVALLLLLFFIACQWKIFSKAGEPGWKSIIPIYSVYINYKISGISTWIFLLYVIFLLPIESIQFISTIGIALLSIYASYKLSKVFEHGIGFTLGLILLPFIFYPILAFGKSEYNSSLK